MAWQTLIWSFESHRLKLSLETLSLDKNSERRRRSVVRLLWQTIEAAVEVWVKYTSGTLRARPILLKILFYPPSFKFDPHDHTCVLWYIRLYRGHHIKVKKDTTGRSHLLTCARSRKKNRSIFCTKLINIAIPYVCDSRSPMTAILETSCMWRRSPFPEGGPKNDATNNAFSLIG